MNKSEKIVHNQTIPLYWKCQLIGWGWFLFGYTSPLFRDDFAISHALINYVLDVSICIALTHAYRTLTLKENWNELDIKGLIGRSFCPGLFSLFYSCC